MSHRTAPDAPTLLDTLRADPEADPQALYARAVDALLEWQKGAHPEPLPPFDETLMRQELALFADAYVRLHRGVTLDNAQRATLDKTFDSLVSLVTHNLRMPTVAVHHDFSPRNVLLAPTGLTAHAATHPVLGPITYDIASLTRDPLLDWEEDFVLDITVRYWEKARKAGLPVGEDFGEFYRDVEWMGLQRHLHWAGVLAQRGDAGREPASLPRLIGHIRATAARYLEFKPLLRLVDQIEGIQAAVGFAYGRM